MALEAPVNIGTPDEADWVGEHRPEFIDLEPIFRSLVEIDVRALSVGASSALEAWRHALPHQVHIVRMLSPRAVHVHVPQALLVRDLVLKIHMPSSMAWRRLTERVEHSRSYRAHLWAHRLRALGIDTPRPLGYLERANKPSRAVSFSASEYVLAETLVEIKDAGLSMLRVSGGSAAVERRAFVES